jgi:hypothetical protein
MNFFEIFGGNKKDFISFCSIQKSLLDGSNLSTKENFIKTLLDESVISALHAQCHNVFEPTFTGKDKFHYSPEPIISVRINNIAINHKDICFYLGRYNQEINAEIESGTRIRGFEFEGNICLNRPIGFGNSLNLIRQLRPLEGSHFTLKHSKREHSYSGLIGNVNVIDELQRLYAKILIYYSLFYYELYDIFEYRYDNDLDSARYSLIAKRRAEKNINKTLVLINTVISNYQSHLLTTSEKSYLGNLGSTHKKEQGQRSYDSVAKYAKEILDKTPNISDSSCANIIRRKLNSSLSIRQIARHLKAYKETKT